MERKDKMKSYFLGLVAIVISLILISFCIAMPKSHANEEDYEYVDLYQISESSDMTVGIPVTKLEFEENRIRKKAGKKHQKYIKLKPKQKKVLIEMGIY